METGQEQLNPQASGESPIRTVTAEGFAIRLQKFEQSYLWLVIGCGCGAALAILLGVLWRVSVGLILAIAVALAYRTALPELLKTHLGLACRRNRDGVTVSVLPTDAIWEELWIPARLLWLDVTELGEVSGVRALHLPRSIRRLGTRKAESSPTQILYEGSPEEWAELEGHTCLADTELACDIPYPRKPSRSKKMPDQAEVDE